MQSRVNPPALDLLVDIVERIGGIRSLRAAMGPAKERRLNQFGTAV